jgi:hypothetical protein
MKTIEQLLVASIETAIDTLTTVYNYDTVITNDIRFKTVGESISIISGIMKTGSGVRSPIPGFDAIQAPMSLMFQVDANFLQRFLGCVNIYCAAVNGVVSSVTDAETEPDTTYSYQMFWNTAIASGAPYSVDFKSNKVGINRESANVVLVVLTGSVLFSSKQTLDDRKIYIEIPVPTPLNDWVSSDVTYWNAQASANRDTFSDAGEDPDDYALATAKAVGFALRVTDGTIPAEYTYYKVGTPTSPDVDTYVELLGVTSYAEELQPTFASDQAITSASRSLFFESYQINYQVQFAWNKDNFLHNFIVKIPHQTITTTSFDKEVRFVITSLSISDDVSCKIANLRITGKPGFETVALTLVRS